MISTGTESVLIIVFRIVFSFRHTVLMSDDPMGYITDPLHQRKGYLDWFTGVRHALPFIKHI